MKKKKDIRPEDAELRRRAEEIARGRAALVPDGVAPSSPEELRQTLHELQVHQIELEMQNDELRTAQEELEASRARYFDLYDLAPVGYFTIGETGLIRDANLTAAAMLGVGRGELHGQPVSRIILVEDQDIYYGFRKRLVETGDPQSCDLRTVKKDGTQIWVHLAATISQDADGSLSSRVVMNDITERKRAGQQLGDRVKELTCLYALSRDKQENLSIDELFRRTFEHLSTAMQFPEIAAPAIELNGERFASRNYREGLSHGLYAEIKIEGSTPGHLAVYYTENRPFVIPEEQNLVDGVAAALSTWLARRRAEEAKEKLESQNRQLQKSESLGRMAGAIAHHFNNQLQAVMMNLEAAIDELPRSGSDARQFLDDAMEASRRAAEVSSLMLTYLGQERRKREPLHLTRLCQLCLPLLRAAMPGSSELNSDLPSPGPVISGASEQIQQLLAILLSNAWEASDGAQCTIALSVRTTSGSEISNVHRFPVDAQIEDSTYACIEVADTGRGIAAEDVEQIFDPFFSSKFTGRGMGLPVVLGIVRAHRGAITVESKPGRGSVFRVYFPLAVVESQPPEQREAPMKKVRTSGFILLVEDEDMVRKGTVTMLGRLGFEVLAAKDGVEALDIFNRRKDEIRCVLCDLTMPRMDGWATLTALRQVEPGIPVILTSGHSEAQVMEGDHPESPQVFLGKPYRLEDLRQAIFRAVSSRSEQTAKRDEFDLTVSASKNPGSA